MKRHFTEYMREPNIDMSPNYVKVAIENEDIKQYNNVFKNNFTENDESKDKLRAPRN